MSELSLCKKLLSDYLRMFLSSYLGIRLQGGALPPIRDGFSVGIEERWNYFVVKCVTFNPLDRNMRKYRASTIEWIVAA